MARERDTGVAVLAETPGALQDVEAICGLNGLEAQVVGPFDLSVALGLGGNTRPDRGAPCDGWCSGGHRLGVVSDARIGPDLVETRRQFASSHELGVRLFTIGTDTMLLHSQASRFVDALRAGVTSR